MPPPVPWVQLHAAEESCQDEVARILEGNGHTVRRATFAAPPTLDLAGCGLIIVDSSTAPADALDCCRSLRNRAGDVVPLLCLLADPSAQARIAALSAGADTCILRPIIPAELLAQVRAFLRIKQLHTRLAEQTAEIRLVNQRLKQAYQQLDGELEAARRLQMSLLPQTLPEVPELRFAVCYRPWGRVGGDFYDVFRLDENHIGFWIADAMGHGVPASLLTIFLKRGVKGKSIHGKHYRLVPPGEVLQRVNRDLIAQQLPEMPFITMLYVLVNFRDGGFRFARAGHPHPLCLRSDGKIEVLQSHGGLLGIFEAEFGEQSSSLGPGDKLLLYTDGLDSGTTDSGSETTRLLNQSAVDLRSRPIEELVPRVGQQLLEQVKQTDDFTILGVERMNPGSPDTQAATSSPPGS
jgi:sigma-B regulation protein RsbU (phosphoserine phosphatase)